MKWYEKFKIKKNIYESYLPFFRGFKNLIYIYFIYVHYIYFLFFLSFLFVSERSQDVHKSIFAILVQTLKSHAVKIKWDTISNVIIVFFFLSLVLCRSFNSLTQSSSVLRQNSWWFVFQFNIHFYSMFCLH